MNTKCNYCHKNFASIYSLERHIKGDICKKKANKNRCNKCNTKFSSKQMHLYHIENTDCSQVESHIQKPKLKIQLKKDENETINQLLLKVSHLEGEVKTLKENPQIQNNIDKQQINNYYIEVPPAFLTLDNLPTLMKMVPDLLPDALSKHPTEFVSFMIKETNCNPKRPLFNSAQITNKKDPYAKISDGEKFIYAPKKQVISQLIENKKSLLQEYVDNNGDKYGEKILKRYQNYLDLLDEDKETIKDLEIEISCMLLNMSEIIGSDDWSKELLNDLKSYDN